MSTAGDPLAERGRFIRQTYRELVELVPRFQAALARAESPKFVIGMATWKDRVDRLAMTSCGKQRGG